MAKYEWYTSLSEVFMGRGYFHNNSTIQDRVEAIATKVGDTFKDEEIYKKVKNYIEEGYYVLPSPVWSNFGTGRGSGISCFNTHFGDSIESIIRGNAEVAMLCKIGGGTSGYFGEIRPAGSTISTGGTTFGSVHFMQMPNTTKQVISQGNTRRGEFAGYQDINHGDIKEFLTINGEGSTLQRFPFGVCVPDQWLSEMKEGDISKREIWASVLDSRNRTGFPYIFFTDNVNKNTVDVYKDKEYKIKSSNMCLIGSDKVLTDEGYFMAKDLYEKGGELNLFDGENVVKSSPMKLREKNAKVYKLTLSNGLSQTVTENHGIAVVKERNKIVRTELKNIKIGDKVAVQTNKGLFGSKDMCKEAFLLGLYQSDGTQNKDVIHIDVWENDFDLVDEIQESFNYIHYKYGCNIYDSKNQYGTEFKVNLKPAKFHNCTVYQSLVKKKRLSSKTLQKALDFRKGFVPDWIWESNEETQWQYVRGLLYADGTVGISKNSFGQPIQIAYADINIYFLKELQILFNNLGLQTNIKILRKKGETSMPDGKGGRKMYKTKDCWRLIIGNKNSALEVEKRTKFLSRKNVYIEDKYYRDNTKKSHSVISIEYVGEENVYCPTVYNEEHIFVSNGIKTFNCTEILLPSSEEESFVCNLIGMNLVKFDDWKDTDAVRIALYIADAVLTDFIETHRSTPFIERAIRFAERHRAIAIGASGYHSYLQSKMIPFESMEAKFENVKIFKTIQEQAWNASREMAAKYGKPDMLKEDKYDRRHTTLTAVAPNTSSSFIMGQQSQSIEPYVSNYYIKKSSNVKHSVKNPYLEKLLEEKGKNTMEVWESILKKSGSVQHLDFLDENEKLVFRTFIEISQMEIIIQNSQRQKYVDQGISLNLMIHPSTPTKDVNALILKAHELGIKTLYYQLGQNAAQEFARDVLSCDSCAG